MVCVFEHQEHAEQSNARAEEWVDQNLDELLPTPPDFAAGVGVVRTTLPPFGATKEKSGLLPRYDASVRSHEAGVYRRIHGVPKETV